ncbi:hypothetical protein WG31_04705 [Acetobacter oryzifermentans]|uniref:Uncharacterized protein n=1 Tax=Acetobacter oryzifermentans TaxID=1633874 RepID=A0ABN4NNV8_9PROT|nr:hypothetical protein WG31_04705 [Acetobacter oryzifermentans]
MRKCESVSVYQASDSHTEQWNVEALNTDGAGGVDHAIFSGPDAKQRAREYASSTYRNGTTRMQQFLAGLTDLCNQHGVGLTGDTDLFLMEREDYDTVYKMTKEGKITT